MATVLVVDDAAFMRMLLRTILENNGFEVIAEAVNGEEAIQKYNEFKPDLVTMDISMPIMTGIEATELICKSDKNAKVVIVSAMGQDSIIRNAIVLGAKSFIVKPYKEDKVIETLRKILIS